MSISRDLPGSSQKEGGCGTASEGDQTPFSSSTTVSTQYGDSVGTASAAGSQLSPSSRSFDAGCCFELPARGRHFEGIAAASGLGRGCHCGKTSQTGWIAAGRLPCRVSPEATPVPEYQHQSETDTPMPLCLDSGVACAAASGPHRVSHEDPVRGRKAVERSIDHPIGAS